MRRITVEERRARLGVRHRLAAEARGTEPADAARDMVALHSTDPSSVYLSCWTRMRDGGVADVERALYEDRSLVRMLAMRRTVFVTTPGNAPVLQAACAQEVAGKERRKLLGFLAESGVARTPAAVERWLAETEEIAVHALASRGEATATELAGDDPRLGVEIVLSRGKRYEGRQKVASRLLFLLAAEGRIVRGRPRGSWTSHQYRWAPADSGQPDAGGGSTPEEAAVELARQWLRTFGPGTAEDLQWWTGWTKTRTKQALTAIGPAEVDMDGVPGLLLPDDVDEVHDAAGPRRSAAAPEPWAALLPALDPTPMGWHERGWFLGEHAPRLFDRMGNIGPSVWWNGRIVGGWAQDSTGEIVVRFLEDAGTDAKASAQAEAELLATRLDGVRLTARTRGRTWLEEELAVR